MMVRSGRYGKMMWIEVESTFPGAIPVLGMHKYPPIFYVSFPYEIDILLE